MTAILMTSLLRPDAELRWANWLKLLQTPQSLILYRSSKIVTKFTRDHFVWPIRHRLIVDMIAKPKFSNSPNVFKIGLFR